MARFQLALAMFVAAAADLADAWPTGGEDADTASVGHPAGIGSFDEFVAALVTWRDSVRDEVAK